MSTSPPRAVFAGLCTLDIIQSVERIPDANQKVVAHDFVLAAGGPATNAAVAFAHVGGTAELVTKLSHHPLTDVIARDLVTCGVNLHAPREGDGPPVAASIMVTRATGDRAVVSPSGAAASMDDEPAPLPSLAGVGAVLVDGYHPSTATSLAQAARASGIPVLMDAGSLKAHTAQVARYADLVIASADLTTPTGESEPAQVFAWLASLGVARAIITRGAEAVLWSTPEGTGQVAVPRVDVVDSLGAGDFFHGALTWRIASRGTADARLAEDIAWASGVVARSLGSFGTRAWLRAGEPSRTRSDPPVP